MWVCYVAGFGACADVPAQTTQTRSKKDISMSDGDTRKPNKEALKDPRSMWAPLGKFKSFKRADQIWVIGAMVFLIVLINVVFSNG